MTGSLETVLGLAALGAGRGAFCFTSTTFFGAAAFLIATFAFAAGFPAVLAAELNFLVTFLMLVAVFLDP